MATFTIPTNKICRFQVEIIPFAGTWMVKLRYIAITGIIERSWFSENHHSAIKEIFECLEELNDGGTHPNNA